MFEYIEGKIDELNPAFVVIDNQGVGYFVNISLTTYQSISTLKNIRIYIHQVVREDAHLLFGFFTKSERSVFRSLISVSGVGANTARMMLSSMNPEAIQEAILSEDVNLLKTIKGIGAKSAQRIIVELKDKIGEPEKSGELIAPKDNTLQEEALSALVMLGFNKSAVEKVLSKLLISGNNYTVEGLIKEALQKL